jgi:hypothetical protein
MNLEKCFGRFVTACSRVNSAIVHRVKVQGVESLPVAVVGWWSSLMPVLQTNLVESERASCASRETSY